MMTWKRANRNRYVSASLKGSGTAATPVTKARQLQQVQSMGMSRRKQHILAEKQQQQRDKYAEDREVDAGDLQTLDEPAQETVSNRVCLLTSALAWLRSWYRCVE